MMNACGLAVLTGFFACTLSQIRLIQLYNDTRSYQAALALVQPLVSELKRLDDKSQLVQVQLIESEAYYALSNYPKSR